VRAAQPEFAHQRTEIALLRIGEAIIKRLARVAAAAPDDRFLPAAERAARTLALMTEADSYHCSSDKEARRLVGAHLK
jgi:hypothetical protein